MRNVILLLLSWMIALFLASCGEESSESDKSSEEARIVPVEVMVMQPENLMEYIDAVGTAEALYDANVSAETAGRVLKIAADVGSKVRTGDTVIVLDGETQRLQLESSRAQLEIAEASNMKSEKDFARVEDLYTSDNISESEFEQARLMARTAKGKYDLALASFGLAQKAYDDTRISAPFDGEITATYVDPGEMVAPGQVVFTIVRTDTIEVNVEVSARDALSLKAGMKANVRSRLIPDNVVTGIVHSVSTKANEATKQFPVKILVPNNERAFLPGVLADVSIVTGSISDAIVVPFDAVLSRNEKKVAFIVENGVAGMRDVSVGSQRFNNVILLSGVIPGDTLVVVGQHSLRDGQKVVITR